MKNTVIFALAAFSAAGSFGASLAMADEANALLAGPEMSRMFARPADLPPGGGLPIDASPKSGLLDVRALGSGNESAFTAGSASATAIIPASSLLGDNMQALLRAPGDLGTGQGFAPIKAASSAKSVSIDLTPRSLQASSQLFLSPSK